MIDNPSDLGNFMIADSLTPDAFGRFFRQAMGRSFTSYLNEIRIARACQLLTETDHPVARIAAEAGYTNLSNFNRRFREHKGITPREYRRRMTDAVTYSTARNRATDEGQIQAWTPAPAVDGDPLTARARRLRASTRPDHEGAGCPGLSLS